MYKVRKELCIGCGLCVQTCPRGAISLLLDHAEIDYSLCNQCSLCLSVCPQGAIVQMVAVSKDKLQATVVSLKQRTSSIIERIENLKQRSLYKGS